MKNINKRNEIIGVILILISFLLLIGFYSNTDAFLLVLIKNIVRAGIGCGGYVIPFLIGFIGLLIISQKKFTKLNKKFYGMICFIVTAYFIISLVTLDKYDKESLLSSIQAIITTNSSFHGGILGLTIMRTMKSIISFAGSLVFLIAMNIISLILIFDKSLYDLAKIFKKKVRNAIPKGNFSKKQINTNSYRQSPKEVNTNMYNKPSNEIIPIDKKKKSNTSIIKFLSKSLSLEEPQEIENTKVSNYNENIQAYNDQKSKDENYNISQENQVPINDKEVKEVPIVEENTISENIKNIENIENNNILHQSYEEIYNIDEEINIDYLEETEKDDSPEVDNELNRKKEALQRTLDNFKVKATIKNIEKGPAVTRYEIEPDRGVKVSKILNLSDDIALALATNGIRIEAPIPGKSLVGIEVPNDVVSTIKLKEIIQSNEFNSSKLKISIALGRDISGKSIVADLATMPHLLIAGATGSGKSVCINTILVSILFKYLPDQVKLILVDPKVVELNVYNGIPHLLIPVVTDPKKASNALNWAIVEMTKRYNKFAEKGVRNIDSYNDLYEKKQIEEKLPYIVIVIDELADLMMVCHNEVEDAIARLAQMARAAGMHLIIATQRPSVDVITGVIKANIPSRISFSVSSSIDSRTILDQSGAEKLLGRGDMLFYPMGYLKPQRIQGAFISEFEVEKFVNEIKKKYKARTNYNEEILEHINNLTSKSNNAAVNEDELIDEAINIIYENNNASTSLVQRKLRIGYNRAASIIEEIERRGIIGTRGSSSKKEILIDREDLENY